MPPPAIISSFLSVVPPEPVLVFISADEAARFQSQCTQGRIYHGNQNPRWVYLPMPKGLQRVRTATFGDIAFEFDSDGHADAFNKSIKSLGKVYQNTRDNPNFEKTVYLGRKLK